MAKLGRDKVALLLACAWVLGGTASAAQNIKSEQGRAGKVIAGTFLTLFGLEAIHSIIGVATSSKLGEYSIGRIIKIKLLRGKISSILNDFLPIVKMIKLLRGKISSILNDFLPIVKMKQKVKWTNGNLEYDSLRKNEKDLDKFLLHTEINESQKKAPEDDDSIVKELDKSKLLIASKSYKAEILLLNLPEFKKAFDLLSDEKSLKEGGLKVEYNAGGNGVAIIEGSRKLFFTINDDGSLTLCNECDGKVEDKFTLKPLKNK